MSKVIDGLAAKFLEARGESGESEQRVIERPAKRLHISRDAGRAFEEILALHQKVDALRERQWAELVAMQQEQIRLLTKLLGTGS